MADGRSFWSGVYGFVQLRDGQVWAFGGTAHMGSSGARIERVDELEPRTLLTRESADEPADVGPLMPITHLFEQGDELLVLAYNDVFRVGKGFEDWKVADGLSLRYKSGRADAVGSYPAVRAALPPLRAGGPVLLATAGDGLLTLDGREAAVRMPTGRLGSPDIVRIEDSAEGLLFLEADERPAWTLRAGGWQTVELAPPFEIDPESDAPQFERDVTSWARTHVLVGPGGDVFTVSDSGVIPGTVVTAGRERGRSVVLGRETTDLAVRSSFITPDGALWNEDGNWLRRFSDGRWRRVARMRRGALWRARAVPAKGPPWLVFDFWKEEPSLWRLDPGTGRTPPGMTTFDLRDGEEWLGEFAASPWADETVLIAGQIGLRVYDPGTGTVGRVDLPDPPEGIRSLARDGLGRLWCGGEGGLVLAVPGAKEVESFADVPEIRRHPVTALAHDPAREDGVIAAFGPRGVAFISAGREP